MRKADAGECIALAPIAYRTICKVLSQRLEMMTVKKGKEEFSSEPGACAGKTLLEIMWDELDHLVDNLCDEGSEAEDGLDKGRADGVAFCIALITNPYRPDMPAIKAEAMDRRAEREEALVPTCIHCAKRKDEAEEGESCPDRKKDKGHKWDE